ncbi:MAG TPA: globin domain-containing protein [Polyangiaceae bacterium]|jgi:hemoglobin-like flavoprotein|nr:globin domain-containing protein [Polyangiaceae bacterium]
MSLNVDLLRQSFELVVERAPNLTQRFYEILFERYPPTREMFPVARRGQQENMLTQALVAVMDHLEDAPWLTSTLHGLGARHVHYGVTDDMYAWVGNSLLATLREVAGTDWNPELEKAWADAYWAIAGLMQEGARLAAEGPKTMASRQRAEAVPPSA